MNFDVNYRKVILVDFDNVIADHESGVDDNVCNQIPKEKAIETIRQLISAGYTVKVFTSLSSRGEDRNCEIQSWLRNYGLWLPVTNIKEPCLAIIDDRAIRFTNWNDVRRYFI